MKAAKNKPAETPRSNAPRSSASDTAWWKLAVGIVLAGQGMLLALTVNLSEPPADVRFALQSVVLGSTLVVVALLGFPLLVGAARAITNRRLTMEALFVVAIIGAMAASLQSYLTSSGAIYFEVVSILLVIYSLNDMLRDRARASAVAATRKWLDQLGAARLIQSDGSTAAVPVETIRAGDLVEVHPGESITIDGRIERGQAFVCETSLTGEPFARVRRSGEQVLAGSVVEDATLAIRATAPGGAREIDGVLQAVEDARRTRISMQDQIDRWTKVFLPVVIAVAAATFGAWWMLSSWQEGMFYAMSVLLVACPCALGLAVPLAVWAAMNQMASRGLVAHQADFVARLARCNHVVFDKTGTLTEDAASVVDVAVAGDVPREKLMSWLASAEQHSQHPVARALAAYPAAGKTYKVTNMQLQSHPGCGLEASFEDCCGNARHLRVGAPRWINAPRAAYDALCSGLAMKGGEPVAVETDGKLSAVCLVGERRRPSAVLAQKACEALQMKVTVMTGDQKDRPAAAGFDSVHAEMSPLDKANMVAQWQQEGEDVLFVGDGINDAAALSNACASIALASGSELAGANAQATLLTGNLDVAPWAVERCRGAMWLIRTNLIWAAAYNVIGMLLAATGFLHPVFAALLMVGSSLIVTGRSIRFASQHETPPGPDASATAPQCQLTVKPGTQELQTSCCK